MRQTVKSIFKVTDFLAWQRGGSLVLTPAFQRRPVWPPGAKSLLIDTAIRGLPMPVIFLRERTDLRRLQPIREVVDGQQRLRTLLGFIDPTVLPDFVEARDSFEILATHNQELAGKSFSQFPTPVRRTILEYELGVHILPSDTDDREVLQIFARMNSTGVGLNHQELRNAAYFGVFKQLMYDLAFEQLDRWRKWRVFSEIDIARMIEVEETSDIVITMVDGLHGKKQSLLNDFYRRFDKVMSHHVEVARRFRYIMDLLDDTLGSELATLRFRRKPLFHTLFAFYYDLVFSLGGSLRIAKPRPLPPAAVEAVRRVSLAIAQEALPESLLKLLRGATGHLPSRAARLQFLHQTFRRFGKSQGSR